MMFNWVKDKLKSKVEYHVTTTGVTWYDKKEKRIKKVASSPDFELYVSAIEALANGKYPSDHPVETLGEQIKPAPVVVAQNLALSAKWRTAASLNLTDAERVRRSLTNFAAKIDANPSNRSRAQLLSFMDRNDIPLMENGNLLAFKRVKSDYWDIHTGKSNHYLIGTAHSMDRKLVDDDPSSSCSTGLHAGGYGYVSWYGGNANPIVAVEIDPADVVSVPNDSDMGKIRCCKLSVAAEFSGVEEMKKASQHLLAVFIDREGVSISDAISWVGSITGKKGNLSQLEKQAVVDFYLGEVNEVLCDNNKEYLVVIHQLSERLPHTPTEKPTGPSLRPGRTLY